MQKMVPNVLDVGGIGARIILIPVEGATRKCATSAVNTASIVAFPFAQAVMIIIVVSCGCGDVSCNEKSCFFGGVQCLCALEERRVFSANCSMRLKPCLRGGCGVVCEKCQMPMQRWSPL